MLDSSWASKQGGLDSFFRVNQASGSFNTCTTVLLLLGLGAEPIDVASSPLWAGKIWGTSR